MIQARGIEYCAKLKCRRIGKFKYNLCFKSFLFFVVAFSHIDWEISVP